MKRFLFTVLLSVLMVGSAFARNIEPNGINQEDLYNFLAKIVEHSNTGTMGYPGFSAHAAASASYDIDNAFSYKINNNVYTMAASQPITPFSASAQAAGTACYYLASVSAAGAVTVTKGTAVSYLGTPVMPSTPANTAAFGALKVVILPDATAGFTLGTSAYNYDASCTITVYNLAQGTPLSLTGF